MVKFRSKSLTYLYNVCLLLPVISVMGMSEIAVREFDCGTGPRSWPRPEPGAGTMGGCWLLSRSEPTDSSCPDMSGLMGILSSRGRPPPPGLGG